MSDGIFTLGYLFLGRREPSCRDAADINDSGQIDISDAVATFEFLFLAGRRPPPPPGPVTCGPDPTSDALDCDFYPSCR